MDDFTTILLVWLLGLWVGWRLRTWVLIQRMTLEPDTMIKNLEMIKSLQRQIEQEQKQGLDPERDNVEVRVETQGGAWYVYRVDTEEFLGQSNVGKDEAMLEASKRHPQIVIWTQQ